MSRNRVILTSLIGLVGAVLVTALCLLVMVWQIIPPPVTDTFYALGLLIFLLFFSLAEIPVMIIGMRRIAASANPKAKYVALLVNVGYVLFGAVYAAPFILLTGWLGTGTALAALSLIRFTSALIYLPNK
ncbi:MAG: hypothetical protein U0401_22420 [Anaerolineae bacterium]